MRHLEDPLSRPEPDPRDELRRRRRNARNALTQLVASIVVVAAALVPGAALGGTILADANRAPAWIEAMADQTADVVAALPFSTLEAMDQSSMLDWRFPSEPVFRVDFSVTLVSTGLRVRATLVDNRTREALKDFVAWRGRT